MGLDMYLNKRTYVGAAPENKETAVVINITKNGRSLAINPKRVASVTEEIGYWRKANHIHGWFSRLPEWDDDKQETEVSAKQLKELLELCKQVKVKAVMTEGDVLEGTSFSDKGMVKNFRKGMTILNAGEIADMLPTESGFFFGSTEYDEGYMRDIDDTIEMLSSLELNEDDWEVAYKYIASW